MNTYLQQNLSRLLKDNKMSYSQLAYAAGISVDTVKKIFRSKTNGTAYVPSGTTLDCIAGVFHIKPEMLLQPSIAQLMEDVEVVKDTFRNTMFKEGIAKADTATKFRIAMVEGGFNSTVPVIDYLQFMGYSVDFLYNLGNEPTKNSVKSQSQKIEKILKEYRTRIEANTKEIPKYKAKYRQLESQWLDCEDQEQEEALHKEMEKVEALISGYEMDNFELNFQLQALAEWNKEGHAKTLSVAEVMAQRKVDVEEAIQLINKLDEVPKRVREEKMTQSGIRIRIKKFADEDFEEKILTLAEFYKKCEEISNFATTQFQL